MAILITGILQCYYPVPTTHNDTWYAKFLHTVYTLGMTNGGNQTWPPGTLHPLVLPNSWDEGGMLLSLRY